MAATGKTPILLYGSTTATNTPSAGNLTNSSDGCEIAINVADKNLFFKDSTNAVNTVPLRQSSASSNGWLSSTDWSTFNSKQPAGSYLTSVTVDAPLTGAGTSGSHLSIPAASGSTNGYLTSADWTTFNSKQPAGTYVTSVTGTAPVVSSGGTTPAISMAAANGSTNGYLTSTDWTTFNGKAPAFTYTTGYIPFGQGTTTPNQSANLFWDNTNKYLGIGTATPASSLHSSVSNATTWTVDDSGATSYTPFATDLSNVNTSAGTLNTFAGIFLQAGANTGGGQVSTARIAAVKTTATYGTALAFSTRRSATGNLTEAGRFTETGDFNVHDGNVVISTSGKGIDFSATAGTGTSELLADYEEGTFTPTLLSGGAAVSRTYSVQYARYTKIGNRVFFNIYITLSAKGSSTGNTTIGGLPYTSNAADNDTITCAAISNVTYTGQITPFIGEGVTAINVYQSSSGAGLAFLTDTGLANNSSFWVTGQYKV